MDQSSSDLSNVVVLSAVATVGLAGALSYVMFSSSNKGKDDVPGSAAVSCDNSLEDHILDKEIYPGGHLTIYYGSQTGTAESFANDMQREGETFGFKVRVVDLEDVGEADDALSDFCHEHYQDEQGRSRAVFLMATYGEAEPTDNAQNFIENLQLRSGIRGVVSTVDPAEEEKNPELFAGLDYAVFGLGNSQYEHFNAMGKLTDAGLAAAGGQRIVALGAGDDDKDLEGDFEQWREQVIWPALQKAYIHAEFSAPVTASTEDLPVIPYVAEFLSDGTTTTGTTTISEEDMHNSTKHFFTAAACPVTTVRELRTAQDPGSTVHVEIDVSNSSINYQTADNLAVLPENDVALVKSLATALSYDLDALFRLRPSDSTNTEDMDNQHKMHHFFPTPCTVQECLSKYVDITSPPRRSELKLLAKFATDPLDKEALLRMASKEGKAEYREKIMGAKIGLVDIVTRLCKSLNNIPLAHLIHICPHLQPRYYTIASSSTVHPDSVHLTVSVLEETRADDTLFKGVCSNYLAKEERGSSLVRVFCRDSSFRLPPDVTKPVIMVGPGTGFAPMRALLQERSHSKHTLKQPVGPNVVYFGCKDRKLDYIYQDEIKNFEKSGDIDLLRVAFSREQAKKVYVQHLIQQDGEKVWNLIDKEGAYVYICGGTKMGSDVCTTLKKLAVAIGGIANEEDAKKYLDHLHSKGRLVQELWG